MKYLMMLLIFLGSSAFAKDAANTPALGTYSAYTEADWTVAFELKNGGKASIITEFHYDYDDNGKRQEHKKTVDGSWEFKPPFLILTYGELKDKLVQSGNCQEKRPCFKYETSLRTKSGKSPLDVKYEFINH